MYYTGKFSEHAGATQPETCQACGPGEISPAGSDALKDCYCAPGFFYAGGGVCAGCPRAHFCHGRLESPIACPQHATTPFWTPTQSEVADASAVLGSIEVCECVDTYFRADNSQLLALALEQRLVEDTQVHTNFCIVCPVGAFCRSRGLLWDTNEPSPSPSPSPSTARNGQLCPTLSSTRTVGSTSSHDCECQSGAYRQASANTSTNAPSGPIECMLCEKNHYCPGIRARQIACPGNTFGGKGMSLWSDCFCLPPHIQVPSFDVDTAFECVGDSKSNGQLHGVEHTTGNEIQHHSFLLPTDMFSVDNNFLACFSVKTGKLRACCLRILISRRTTFTEKCSAA